MNFDAVLLLSFGGPEAPEQVMPFLANVLRGRPVAPERVSEVAAHYLAFGGRSPINDQNRALLAALAADPAMGGRRLYWGNRNWEPYVGDTVARMAADGVARAAVFVTSAYSSYSGCRQYIEDLQAAAGAIGPSHPAGPTGNPTAPGGPELVKLRPYFNHPGFVAPLADGLRAAMATVGGQALVVMSAHSIPSSSAAGCDYEAQLAETAALVSQRAGVTNWRQVYQSRSGAPGQPWLGPDVLEVIDEAPPGSEIVVCPIGFVSDHMEVIYDLDTQAAQRAAERRIRLVRSPTPGTDPRFVAMVAELVGEMEDPRRHPPRALGRLGARRCPCPPGCCPGPVRVLGPQAGTTARSTAPNPGSR